MLWVASFLLLLKMSAGNDSEQADFAVIRFMKYKEPFVESGKEIGYVHKMEF